MPNNSKTSEDAQELVAFTEDNEASASNVTHEQRHELLSYSQALKSLLVSTAPYQAARIPFALLKLGEAIVIGQLSEDQALAAPFSFAYSASVMGMTRGMCTAVGPRVARAFGSGDRRAIVREYGLGWIASAELTLVTACFFYLSGPTAKLLGTSDTVAVIVRNYGLSVIPGLIGIHGSTCDQSFFAGINQTRWMMVLSTVFSLICMGVGFPLSLTTSLGLTGLGLGTSSAALTALVLGQILLMRKPYRSYRLLSPRFDDFFKEMKAFLKEASIIGVLRSLEWFNWAVIVGMTYLTRNNGAVLALQVTLQPVSVWNIFSMGQAFVTRLKVAKEAGQLKQQLASTCETQHRFYENIAHYNMRRLTVSSLGLSIAGATLVGGSMIFFPDSYAKVFLSEEAIDEEVLAYTQAFMLINGIGIILDSFRQMGTGMLGGIGDVNVPTFINFFFMSVVGLSAGGGLTLLLDWGENWLFITRDVGILLASAAIALRVYSQFKTTIPASELLSLEGKDEMRAFEKHEDAVLLPRNTTSASSNPALKWKNNVFSFFQPCSSSREKPVMDATIASLHGEQKNTNKKRFY